MLTVSSVRGDLREKILLTFLKQKVSPYDFKDCAASQSLRAQELFTTTCRGGCPAALPENLRIHPVRSACTGATAETTASQLLRVVSEGAERHWCPEWPHLDANWKQQLFQGPRYKHDGSCGSRRTHTLEMLASDSQRKWAPIKGSRTLKRILNPGKLDLHQIHLNTEGFKDMYVYMYVNIFAFDDYILAHIIIK